MIINRLMGLALFALLLMTQGCTKKGEEVVPPTTLPPATGGGPSQVALWLTNTDRTAAFRKQATTLNFGTLTNQNPIIAVDTAFTYQTIDGFGYTLTGASALVIKNLPGPARANLLRELFATDSTWLGVSYLRLSIGASDLSDRVFTYNDLPSGQTDEPMARFSLAPEQASLLPVLREILAINPNIKILGSPWTAPSWMKSNGSPVGGSLLPQYYEAYARYFVKYVQGMAAEGVRIDAVTLQNEPLNANNEPSMLMSDREQITFVRDYVGPAFQAAGLTTKIIAYDHNADRPDYPINVLNDAGARAYIDGSAFHLYAGSITALTQVHNAFPSKNIYFTEQWTGAPGNFINDVPAGINDLVIGATRNWSRNVLQWNLAADGTNGPHTSGGCNSCLPAVTVTSTGGITRNPAYYVIAHASKFVRPGSVRIGSSLPTAANLPNVAFQTPTGKKVLIVLNRTGSVSTFNIQYRNKLVATTLAAGSTGTYVW